MVSLPSHRTFVGISLAWQSRFNHQCTRQAKSAVKPSVIPAKAGIHTVSYRQIYPFQRLWIPVSTGMTIKWAATLYNAIALISLVVFTTLQAGPTVNQFVENGDIAPSLE